MLTGALIGAGVGLIVGLIGWLIAANTKAPIDRWSSYKETRIPLPILPDAALPRAARAAPGAGLNVEHMDEIGKVLFLSSRVDFSSWGFFYRIQFLPDTGGGSFAILGIKSRLIQLGPIVEKRLEGTANWLAEAVRA